MRPVTRNLLATLTALLIVDAASALDIPAAAREQVERQCLPTQLRSGADAYRQCVSERLATIDTASGPSMSALDMDERYLIQNACGASDTACIEEQIARLTSESDVSLAALSIDEQLVLRNTCLQSNDGRDVVTYRRCVSEQVTQLAALPKPALGNLTLLERNALELSCGSDTANAISYRQCLVEMAGAGDNATSAASSPTDAPAETSARALDSQDNDSINAAEVATSDYLDLGTGDLPIGGDNTAESVSQPDETTASSAAIDAVPVDAAEESSGMATLVDDARTRLLDSWQGLDTVGRSVLGAALVLPLLLIGLWAVMRQRGDDEYEYVGEDLRERHEPDFGLAHDARPVDEAFDGFDAPARAGPDTRLADTRLADDRFADDRFADDRFADDRYASDSVASDQFAGDASDEAVPETRLAQPMTAALRGARQPSLERDIDLDLDENVTRVAPKPELNFAEHRQKPADFAWQSAFGEWICKQPAQTRLQSVIEFLIYWVAYGDDRYDAQMRESVLSKTDPDSHDLIKRWVLEYDAYALADAISWMQSHASRAERYQTLDLLMTLLVTDGAMTPVQNTLLRFLSDAFGLGEAELDLQYSRAFGEPMPALPRVDKPNWWAQQDQVRMERWDALGLLLRPEHEQYRIRLGLSLSGELDQQDINDAYRRAARRCQPERFDALGQRELALVKRQLGKLHEAREGLLGVNA